MTVIVYRSDDAGAPTLSGSAGALVAVLDACLINGYGSKVAAGWGKPYSSGATIAAYRAPAGTNRRYLRVDDGGSQIARLVAYESMSSITVGVNAFPTNAQMGGGMYTQKSTLADGSARAWMCVASDKAFFFLAIPDNSSWFAGVSASSNRGQFFFGEIVSYKPGDVFNTLLLAMTSDASFAGRMGAVSKGTSMVTGHYMARNHLQIGQSINVSKQVVSDTVSGTTCMGQPNSVYPTVPDSVTGRVMLSRVSVSERISPGDARVQIRGIVPGLWAPLHARPFSHGETFVGDGDLAGRTFAVVDVCESSTLGTAFIEISDTWYS